MFTNKKKNEGLRENSNGTFKWREKTKTNKRKSAMREHLSKFRSTRDSIGVVNLLQAVCLPNKPEDFVENPVNDKLEISEWLAENTVDFFNEAYVLFSFVTEDNPQWENVCQNPDKYTNKGYPVGVKYLWKTTKTSKAAEQLVNVYVEHIFVWIDAQIDNEDIFPTEEDTPFPDSFRSVVIKIFQRLFRVFAIIFTHECLMNSPKVEKKQLKTALKHFMYFAWKWDLINEKETKCIDTYILPIKAAFDKDFTDRQRRLGFDV